jgi:hypothetical protein
MSEDSLRKEFEDLKASLIFDSEDDDEFEEFFTIKKPLIEKRMNEIMKLLRPFINAKAAKEALELQEAIERKKKREKKERALEDARIIKEKTELLLSEYEEQAKNILTKYVDPETMINTYILPDPRSDVITLELALILQKLENQKNNLINLIKKRKKLDEETLLNTGGKGITDFDRISSLYDVKQLKQFLFDEQFTFDSDDDDAHGGFESSDDDMPRITEVTLPDGTADIKIENYMTYISRLRARSVSGNESVVINIENLMRRIGDMERLQSRLKQTYDEKMALIKSKYGNLLTKATQTLEEYKWEIADMKKILSRGTMMLDSGAKESKIEEQLKNLTEAMKDQIEALDELQVKYKEAKEKISKQKEKKKEREREIEMKEREIEEEREQERKREWKKKEKEVEEQLEKEREAEASKLLEKRKREGIEREQQEKFKKDIKSLKKEMEEKAALQEVLIKAAEIKYKNLMNLEKARWDEEKFELKTTLVQPLMEKVNLLESAKLRAENNLKLLQEKQAISEKEYQDALINSYAKGYEKRRAETTKEVKEIEVQTEITGVSESDYYEAYLAHNAAVNKITESMNIRVDFFLAKKFETEDLRQEEFERIKGVFAKLYNELPPLPVIADMQNIKSIDLNDKLNTFLNLKTLEYNLKCQKKELAEKTKLAQEAEKKYLSVSEFDLEIKNQAFELSELARNEPEKCHSSHKFFSYHIREWEPKFAKALGCSEFTKLNIKTLSIEENKKMFRLLCSINKYTGSKSHIWFGNELNRLFNKRDSRDASTLTARVNRAQDTYLCWFDKSAAKGFQDLQADLITDDSIIYADLLRSIGNTYIARPFIDVYNIKELRRDLDIGDEARLEKQEKQDFKEEFTGG